MPAPNKAVLALTSVAALMVLAEMRPIHKTIYVFLIVALVFTENRAIDKDRREFAENEAFRRGQVGGTPLAPENDFDFCSFLGGPPFRV
jgi:hypothetical protein